MDQEKIASYVLAVQRELDECSRTEDRAVYHEYLSHISVVLAKVVLNLNVSSSVESFERFIGNSWLMDTESYNRLYKTWAEAKES